MQFEERLHGQGVLQLRTALPELMGFCIGAFQLASVLRAVLCGVCKTI